MSMFMPFVFIYVTASSEQEGQMIVHNLLQQRLIACANIFPVKSMYLEKEKIINRREVILILKTREEKSSRVKREIENIHSYKIPAIIKIAMVPNESYGKWLNFQLP